MRPLLAQLLRFGVVGGVGFVIDVAIFNALRLTVLAPEVVESGPLLAKVVSTSVAIGCNWIGNRYWTFGTTRRRGAARSAREGLDFALVSVGGMLIGLACLWVSHYALGFTSVLADNISSNVIGLALGTAFRFWLYRTWVFAPRPGPRAEAQPDATGVESSGASEGAVLPTRLTPLHRIQAVATVDDRTTRGD
ncbi:MAG: GtrA family protein [Cryobacterium sp.]|nr:GtrA family protein [Cryobacterium sp.]